MFAYIKDLFTSLDAMLNPRFCVWIKLEHNKIIYQCYKNTQI